MQSPLRVLVVEDNEQTARSLAWLIEVWGHEVRVAEDAPSALAIVPEFFPDVVLLDIGLPGMDGFEFAEILGMNLSLRHTVLVALTAHGDEFTRLRAKAAGVSEHLVKPADLDSLQSILTHIKQGRSGMSTPQSNASTALPRFHNDG